MTFRFPRNFVTDCKLFATLEYFQTCIQMTVSNIVSKTVCNIVCAKCCRKMHVILKQLLSKYTNLNNAILNRFTSAFCLATTISYCVVGKRRKCSKYNQNMNILKFSSLFLLLKNIKRPICFFNISIRTIIIHNLTSE